jgi:hypothetical protein
MDKRKHLNQRSSCFHALLPVLDISPQTAVLLPAHYIVNKTFISVYLNNIYTMNFPVLDSLDPFHNDEEDDYVPPKRRFLEEPHCATSQKTAFFKISIGFQECPVSQSG